MTIAAQLLKLSALGARVELAPSALDGVSVKVITDYGEASREFPRVELRLRDQPDLAIEVALIELAQLLGVDL